MGHLTPGSQRYFATLRPLIGWRPLVLFIGALACALFLPHPAFSLETDAPENILSGVCWSPEQLRGAPNEKTARKLSKVDLEPPGRTAPLTTLPPLAPEYRGSIRRVDVEGDEKLLALTFDLCEQSNEISGYDAEIINYLRDNGVQATFFAGGKWMRSHPEKTMQLMADPLFELGNHSWTHGNLRVIQGERMIRQITWAQAQYELLWERLADRATGMGLHESVMDGIPKVPTLFRFPYGTCNAASLQALAERGLAAIQWDVVTADPVKAQSARAIAQAVLRQAKPGSIVICHANGRGWNTARALPMFIPEMRKRGFRFVTVSELLVSGRPVAQDECYEMHPGDNKRYDKIFGEGTR